MMIERHFRSLEEFMEKAYDIYSKTNYCPDIRSTEMSHYDIKETASFSLQLFFTDHNELYEISLCDKNIIEGYDYLLNISFKGNEKRKVIAGLVLDRIINAEFNFAVKLRDNLPVCYSFFRSFLLASIMNFLSLLFILLTSFFVFFIFLDNGFLPFVYMGHIGYILPFYCFNVISISLFHKTMRFWKGYVKCKEILSKTIFLKENKLNRGRKCSVLMIVK